MYISGYLFSVLNMGSEDVYSQEGMNAKQIVKLFSCLVY